MTTDTIQKPKSTLESYFDRFKDHILGINAEFDGPYGRKKIIYADWTASGRLYGPIEDLLVQSIYPYVGNTHTETTFTGCAMTIAYHKAKHLIKEHVGAFDSDVLISANSGMTGVVNKLQRILGLRVHEKHIAHLQVPEEERPVVFVTHMEHHSNQTSWIECLCKVEIIQPNEKGLVDLNYFGQLLEKYKDRKQLIAAVTSCSNVSGIKTPYHEIARMIHAYGGVCFVDFACSAPYIDITMRPDNEEEHLDAIYFSPHKFLGGPGSSGILVFCPKLYTNRIPDNPGGGTVDWTNPWGEHKYLDAIEEREDGGTPAFLQTMKVAMAVRLKEEMKVENILKREKEILDIIWPRMSTIPGLHILAENVHERLGVISFYIDGMHYNLGVKLLNDRFGIQMRGGCSCAGTYGHYLLAVSEDHSHAITCNINAGDLSDKPGWIRMSIHPTTTNSEVHLILDALESLALNHEEWAQDYIYNPTNNEFYHKTFKRDPKLELIDGWFEQPLH